MKAGFLVFAVLLNVGFAALVFWWGLRELRRSRRKDPAPTDRR